MEHLKASSLQGLKRLNTLPVAEADQELRKCCGCAEWTTRMTTARPFDSVDQLLKTAEQLWWSLEPGQWLEAFHSHPKIGEQKAAAALSADAQKWSENEQSGIRDSAPETIDALARLNREYEQKFGYIFIICASGKSSEEMLSSLRARLENEPHEELRIAAAEQAKITDLRLRKLIQTST